MGAAAPPRSRIAAIPDTAPDTGDDALPHDAPDISVVIPHYADPAGLDACLAALGAQTFAGRVEVIVADNASPGGVAAVAAVARGRARIVDTPERGAGPARNAGVAAVRGGVLAFTDSDCVPAPGWLAAGIAALGDADVIGGAMTVLVADEAQMSGAEAFERVFAFNNRRYIAEERFSVTANLFCRATVFATVGPFRTGVSEDIDWCHRAIAAGFTLRHAPEAVVAHPARRDWPALRRKWQRIGAERSALLLQRPGGRLRWALRTAALPLSIIAHAPRVLASPALPDRRARARALGTLIRLRLWRTADGVALLLGRTAR